MNSPAWFAEAKILRDDGWTADQIGKKLGKRPGHVKVALNIDGARVTAADAHKRWRRIKREEKERTLPPPRGPLAGQSAPRAALKSALMAYDAGKITLKEMVEQMQGAVA
jgi:hypothetical protein